MTILKKKRIIQLSIYKSVGWYGNEYQKILEPTKIPLIRLPVKCGRKCEFSRICSFLTPSFKFEGLKIHKIQKYPPYVVSENSICNCGFGGSKFEYIFTYEIIRHYLPVDVLKEMGLYKEPKAVKKQIFFDNPPKNYNTKNIKSYGGGNRNYKNYNARRR
jgi:hypothetical protein